MNGANYNDRDPYEPQISSYDYDAPLDEAGNATDKFMKFRAVIEKHLPAGQKLPSVPKVKPVIVIPDVRLKQATSLFDILPTPKLNPEPLTFEDLNQAYGFMLYRTIVDGGVSGTLKIKDLRDYGIIFINGKRVGVLDRRHKQDSLQVHLPKGKVKLEILVENLGRINFGPYLLKNKKGITEKVLLAGKELKNWKMYTLPFSSVNGLAFKAGKINAGSPVIKKGTFDLKKVADTYLDMRNWGKGVVWVNGHNLGRYWSVGPQQTIYLPAEWLKKTNNEVVVLELLKSDQTTLKTLSKPILNELD